VTFFDEGGEIDGSWAGKEEGGGKILHNFTKFYMILRDFT